jgi:hypothetical protein
MTISERPNESTIRTKESKKSGFIRDKVLIPEVLIMMISLLLIIKMSKVSMEIRNARGSIKFRYRGARRRR